MLLKDNSGRAKTVVTSFYVFIPVTLLAIALGIYNYQNYGDYALGTDDNIIIMLQGLVGLGQVVINIVLIVVFINWFRRAYANLHRMGIGYLSHTDLHAAWCWFVPILNLFRPYQIMSEIWSETQHQVKKLNDAFQVNTTNGFIGAWWALYLISRFVSNYATRKSFQSYSIEDLENSALLTIISDLLHLISAILALMVVKKISGMESLLTHELEATSFGQKEEDSNLEEQNNPEIG